MKLQTLQILQIFIECRNILGGASVHISKHSLCRLKTTVRCRLCAYPSIHLSLDENTLKFTVCCRLCANPSIHFFVSRSRSLARRAHIQAFTLKLSRSRSLARRAHIQAFTLKLSRSRSLARRAHIQAFTLLLVLELSRSRSLA